MACKSGNVKAKRAIRLISYTKVSRVQKSDNCHAGVVEQNKILYQKTLKLNREADFEKIYRDWIFVIFLSYFCTQFRNLSTI